MYSVSGIGFEFYKETEDLYKEPNFPIFFYQFAALLSAQTAVRRWTNQVRVNSNGHNGREMYETFANES